MSVAIVLFTGDLRLHDHPPLRAALDGAEEVVPLFVCDRAIEQAGFAVPNRAAFLADCLADLDAALRGRGGRLVVRRGAVADQVCRVAAESGADQVHLSAAPTSYAHRREEALRGALKEQGARLVVHDGVQHVVAPGEVTPASSDHFAVFTPYLRHWSGRPLRSVGRAPRSVRVPGGVYGEPLPERSRITGTSPGLARGGETAGRARLAVWLRDGLDAYDERHDDLAGDATSRLSPHLHFGTLSPVECVQRARARRGAGADAFLRQVAWRDFHHQVLAARPRAAGEDYRSRHDRWRGDGAADDVAAWKEGRTGFPIVDAAMRQLAHEGWMHNRGRLLAASFLTKTLYVDWRIGARHFLDLLVDGDVASNQLNWQWVAGTGTDTRPNRVLNPLLQARRHDPDGVYVRRWVPELRGVEGRAVHEPWRLPSAERSGLDYPDPITDLSAALDRFRRARGRA
jgi:deoxyribodipyrimidine photo-lyase